jgi:hypothetical protein
MAKRDDSLLAEIERDVLSGVPVADALRKCVVLGGRLASTDLRDWATKELRGYGGDDDVPAYRTVVAPLYCDAVAGHRIITGQRISPRDLPEFTHNSISESYTIGVGVGEIEALIQQASSSGGMAKLSLPMAADLARYMDSQVGDPWQHITALYWQVAVSSLEGVVDQVKTTIAQLVSELRAVTPEGAELPSPAAAAQAVSVAAHGKARVTVNNIHATGSATASLQSPAPPVEAAFWTRGRKVGATIVGAAGIVSAVLGAFQVYGSPF